MKQAASLPSPPLPSPASGSSSMMAGRLHPCCCNACLTSGSAARFEMLFQRGRPPQQELQRKVVNALCFRVLALAGGPGPTMGNEIANESAGGVEFLPAIGVGRIGQLLAEQVAFSP